MTGALIPVLTTEHQFKRSNASHFATNLPAYPTKEFGDEAHSVVCMLKINLPQAAQRISTLPCFSVPNPISMWVDFVQL